MAMMSARRARSSDGRGQVRLGLASSALAIRAACTRMHKVTTIMMLARMLQLQLVLSLRSRASPPLLLPSQSSSRLPRSGSRPSRASKSRLLPISTLRWSRKSLRPLEWMLGASTLSSHRCPARPWKSSRFLLSWRSPSQLIKMQVNSQRVRLQRRARKPPSLKHRAVNEPRRLNLSRKASNSKQLRAQTKQSRRQKKSWPSHRLLKSSRKLDRKREPVELRAKRTGAEAETLLRSRRNLQSQRKRRRRLR